MSISAVLVPLKTLIELLEEGKELIPLLSSFSCEKDKDIEFFLREKAITFENLSKARTYLVFSKAELCDKNKKLSDLTIYGYISLALKILSVPSSTSNRVRKELDGYSAKIHGDVISDFPCYLIGQLARNSKVSHGVLDMEQLLKFAYDVIATSVDAVGGRYIMIECKDSPSLVKLYEDNGFNEISRIPDGKEPMVQMIHKI